MSGQVSPVDSRPSDGPAVLVHDLVAPGVVVAEHRGGGRHRGLLARIGRQPAGVPVGGRQRLGRVRILELSREEGLQIVQLGIVHRGPVRRLRPQHTHNHTHTHICQSVLARRERPCGAAWRYQEAAPEAVAGVERLPDPAHALVTRRQLALPGREELSAGVVHEQRQPGVVRALLEAARPGPHTQRDSSSSSSNSNSNRAVRSRHGMRIDEKRRYPVPNSTTITGAIWLSTMYPKTAFQLPRRLLGKSAAENRLFAARSLLYCATP